MAARPADPHLPAPAPIEAYGKGGFRFAGMSHRGSLLCLPSGVRAWEVRAPQEVSEAALALVFAEANDIALFLLGTGQGAWTMPEPLRWRFRDQRIAIEVTTTGAAVRTYNILLGEGRRVGAGLIAVD
jgi:uncharacterized protein